MIDWDRITELKNDMGQDEFPALVSIFLDEVENALSNLNGQTAPIEADFHFLKGSALTLGFQDLAKLASAGEIALHQDADAQVEVSPIAKAYDLEKRELLENVQILGN